MSFLSWSCTNQLYIYYLQLLTWILLWEHRCLEVRDLTLKDGIFSVISVNKGCHSRQQLAAPREGELAWGKVMLLTAPRTFWTLVSITSVFQVATENGHKVAARGENMGRGRGRCTLPATLCRLPEPHNSGGFGPKSAQPPEMWHQPRSPGHEGHRGSFCFSFFFSFFLFFFGWGWVCFCNFHWSI